MYIPAELPIDSIESLQIALNQELRKISEAFQTGEFETINLRKLNVALDKDRDGDVLYADGTNYDPGSGKGFYYFDGTIYTKLG